MVGPAILRKAGLELLDSGPADELSLAQNGFPGVVQLDGNIAVGSTDVEKWNRLDCNRFGDRGHDATPPFANPAAPLDNDSVPTGEGAPVSSASSVASSTLTTPRPRCPSVSGVRPLRTQSTKWES